MFSSDTEDNSFHSAVSQSQAQRSTAPPPPPPRQGEFEDDEHEESLPDLDSIISESRTTSKGLQRASKAKTEWQDLHDDDSLPPLERNMKKVYVPRTSNIGFYREVSVSVEEAERLRRTNPRSFRVSDVSVIDLTEDP